MHGYDERVVKAYMKAVGRLIDPHRKLLADRSPYFVMGGSTLDRGLLVRHAHAAHAVDADLVHLVFDAGSELEGPTNVIVACIRDNVIHMKRECRFWTAADGTPLLIAKHGDRCAQMSFDRDGMDMRPGRPRSSLETGYRRASRLLRRTVEETLATGMARAA